MRAYPVKVRCMKVRPTGMRDIVGNIQSRDHAMNRESDWYAGVSSADIHW